jgi:hypothetical protein
MEAGSTVATFSGTYKSGGDYSLSACIDNLGYSGVIDIFRHLTGNEIVPPILDDISVGSASITLSSRSGLTIKVDKLQFGRYISLGATIDISSDGVIIRGDVADQKFEGLTLEQASICVSLMKVGSSRSSGISISGEVVYMNITFAAAVDLSKTRGNSGGTQWTVYGTVKTNDDILSLSSCWSALKGSFLSDVCLRDLTLIISSVDDPQWNPTLNPQHFPIKKGLSFRPYDLMG